MTEKKMVEIPAGDLLSILVALNDARAYLTSEFFPHRSASGATRDMVLRSIEIAIGEDQEREAALREIARITQETRGY